jgi:hypothetical protein
MRVYADARRTRWLALRKPQVRVCAAPVLSQRKQESARRGAEMARQEYDKAWRKARRVDVLETELAGTLTHHVRKNKEAQLRDINNWFAPLQKRRMFQWHREVFRVARTVEERASAIIPLTTLLQNPSICDVLKNYNLSTNVARRYLSGLGFGLQKPGRPKNNK